MAPEAVLDAVHRGVEVALLLILILLLPALLAGLVVSMLQAATGIQEMTLSFIPKLLVVLSTIILAGPWIMSLMVDYTRTLIEEIPLVIGL